MSEMREKVKFAPNVERNLTLMFDSGKKVSSQFGISYLWGVTEGGEEKSMFATETLNSLINALQPKKGDTITIKKVMEEGATTPHFTVNGKTIDTINIGSSFKDKVDSVINGEFAGKPPQVEIAQQLDRIEKKLDDFVSHVKAKGILKDLL
tara:strand:+ start:530 stop:982 length:453 start_codon:yes stop_codon:yes gene_type:complete